MIVASGEEWLQSRRWAGRIATGSGLVALGQGCRNQSLLSVTFTLRKLMADSSVTADLIWPF